MTFQDAASKMRRALTEFRNCNHFYFVQFSVIIKGIVIKIDHLFIEWSTHNGTIILKNFYCRVHKGKASKPKEEVVKSKKRQNITY